eukprot:m.135424 g.135424  ORF g.135424 m.135424 type:complete len:118 (+) comp22593_c1_seq1:166-519(+)
MAEKMEGIFEQDVPGYRCSECGLTAYYPKTCKEAGHSIEKVKKIKKRWFTCNYCSYHFFTLANRMPAHRCNKCSRTPPAYTKAPMKKAKQAMVGPGGGPALKVRGREQKFIGSAVKQ